MSEEYCPILQSSQLDIPSVVPNFPASHDLHSVAPAALLYLPAMHGRQIPCTTSTICPVLHDVQVDEPLVGENVPSAHSLQSLKPSLSANLPIPQRSHDNEAVVVVYIPDLHLMHAVCPTVLCACPGTHSLHLFLPSLGCDFPISQDIHTSSLSFG